MKTMDTLDEDPMENMMNHMDLADLAGVAGLDSCHQQLGCALAAALWTLGIGRSPCCHEGTTTQTSRGLSGRVAGSCWTQRDVYGIWNQWNLPVVRLLGAYIADLAAFTS